MRFMMRLKSQVFVLLLAFLPSSTFPQCTRCGPAVSVSPKSLVFTSQVGTRSAPKIITVTNHLPIPVRLVVSTTGPFQSAGCGGLGGHSSCTISVTLAPVTPGPAVGATNISDGTPLGHFKVQLSGTGVAATINESKGAETPTQHHRFRFIDLGTFGGHNSLTNGGSVVINEHNVVVGAADTATPCLFFPDAPVSIPFSWSKGAKTKLPLLPGGCSGFPIAINESGVIVGVADNGVIDPATGFPEIHAVVWRGRTITDLGTFGGANSLAGAVNGRGQITGVAQNAEPDPFNFGNLIGLPSSTQWRGFLWENGVMHDLGTLGGPDAAVTGDLALNERGQIAGLSFIDDVINPLTGVPTLDSFLWNDGFVDLGTLGGAFTYAFTLNNRGQVSGYSDVAGDVAAHAFRWSKGRLQDLGTLGGSFAGGGWINDAGVVIGASTTPGDATVRGVIWRGRGIEELGTLDGDDCSDAFVVNAKSQVIGPSFNCSGNKSSGYLWDDGVLLDLNAFVPPTSELHVIVSKFINDRGMITGAGVLPNGDEHAVLFIPCYDDGDDCSDGSQGVRATTSGRAASWVRESRPPQTLQEIESGFMTRRVTRHFIAGSTRVGATK